MKRSRIGIVIGVALLVGSAPFVLGAQAMPGVGAKGAAQRAVDKTNARLSQQTGQAVPKPRGAGSAAQPAASGTKAPATAASTPAATPVTRTATAAGSPAPAAKNAAATARDSAKAPAKPEVAFSREVFSYDPAGRRDPFMSLLASGDLRPAYSDLKLVAVAYDPTGRKSVAVMRDVSTNDQYRVKVGQTLGRMRVAQIHPKSVTFTIDEFGYSRQEILALGDSTNTRNP